MPWETLKRGHTLRGKKLTPLIRTIRRSTANPTDLARIDPSRPTEDMSLEEMEDIFSTLTGETMEDILEMAGKEVTMPNGQLLIHHTVMFANEVGQPSEQDLVDTPITPQAHEAALTAKQVTSTCSLPCSSSSSAPTPDPSTATRPVAAPATSSSTSSSAHAAEVLGGPEAPRQLPTTCTGGPKCALNRKASDINPESGSVNAEETSTSETPIKRQRLDDNTREKELFEEIKELDETVSLSASELNADYDDQAEQTIYKQLVHGAASAPKQVASPGSQPCSTSSSPPIPDPSTATRPVASSSSTSSPAHAAEGVGEPESLRQLPSTSTGGPRRALTMKASNINPEVSKALLQNNRMVLVNNGDFRYIKDQLLQDAILEEDEMETVNLPVLTRGGKMSKLVDILVLKSGNHVVRFFESLEKADEVLYSQLDMSPEKTRRDNCSSSGKTDHLSIIREELKDWYKQSMAKIKPMPWCEWFEQDLDHVYTNVRVVEGKKHQISHTSLPGVTESTDEMDASSLLERVFSPTNGRTICFVEGVAGVGKSIFCRRSVYLWSKGEGSKFDLVLLLAANLLKGVLKTDIREQLFPEDFLSADDVYSCLQDKKTNALLVIDGLDEIDTNSEGMKCVMQLIQGKILRKVDMLLTGRPEVSKTFVEYARVHLEICGFTDTNVETYISKYFSNDPNRKTRLLELLKSHWQLADVARTPFTTLLLCVLAEETDGDVPDKIDEIYRQVISLVFNKYVRKLTDRAQDSAHSTSTEEVPGAAETSEGADITETELLQEAAGLAHNLECSRKQNCLEKDLPEICNKADHLLKSGILNRDYTLSRMHDASAYCYFPHRSIQEYLCAWYLSISTDELAKKINVNLIAYGGITEFYISIYFRDAQTALPNVDIALDVVNNAYPWHDDKRRRFEFYLAKALWERIPNKATKEFLLERIFGTLKRALCCLRHVLEDRFYTDQHEINGYLPLMEKLLTDGPLSQRSHKYDDSVSLPDVPVVFRLQHWIHHSCIPAYSRSCYHQLSYATAITLLPNKVDRLKIDDLWSELCGADICIVLVLEDLHDDSSQRDIFGIFALELQDCFWRCCEGKAFLPYRWLGSRELSGREFRRRRRHKRDAYLQREGIRVIRLRPTIRVEAGVHPETKLSRTVSVDCSLKTPFYKMYYDRFCPY